MNLTSGILSSFCAGPQSGLFKALDRWGDINGFAVQQVGLALPSIDPSGTQLLHLRPILIEGMPVRRDALSGFAGLVLTAAAMVCRGARLGMMRTAQRATMLTRTWPAEATGSDL